MKKASSIILVVCFLSAGCDYIKNYKKPVLELERSTPLFGPVQYTLTISDFKWSYGMIEINKYSGDFEKLDRKVFDLLKGKSGTCTVYMTSETKDQYGSTKASKELIGELDLQELNKYKGWEYWNKVSGIRSLLKEKFKTNKESVAEENVLVEESNQDDLDTANPDLKSVDDLVQRSGLEPLTISQKELYPSPKIRAIQDSIGYIYIEGIITQIDIDNGILVVEGNDGKQYNLMLEIHALPNSTLKRLAKVLIPGTRILSSATAHGSKTVLTQVRFDP